MKKSSKEVKSDKAVIGVIEIPIYENLKEAITALSEAKVLGLVNRQYASDLMNEFRAGKTRTASPVAQLNRLAKTNPDLQKAIETLVKKYSAPAA